jgi:hypothetical protein
MANGRRRIRVSNFPRTIQELLALPVFNRDPAGRSPIMGRHARSISVISHTRMTIAKKRLQHLLHFTMAVMECIHWYQVYMAMWGGYFYASEEFHSKATGAILRDLANQYFFATVY